MQGKNSGGTAAGQATSSGLACKYNNKSPQLTESKSVEMCESGAYTVMTWDPAHPETPTFKPFRCLSWRHPGPCQRWKGAQDFVRCRDAILKKGDHWVYAVLTFDQKQFINEWAAYRGGVHRWHKLSQRLERRFGRVEYLQTWEKHESGWPHVNVAIHNESIWAACKGDGWRVFRREVLNPQAIQCGFGLRVHLEPLRAGASTTLAGYLTKLSRELTGAGTKNQVPVNAPPHFRRIRASQDLLPAVHHQEGRTGMLVLTKLLGNVGAEPFILGQMRANQEAKKHGRRRIGKSSSRGIRKSVPVDHPGGSRTCA